MPACVVSPRDFQYEPILNPRAHRCPCFSGAATTMTSSPGIGKQGLGIVLASPKHCQSLVQNEGKRTIRPLLCLANPSLLLLWEQRGILFRCGSLRWFPQLLSHLIQVVGGLVSKGGPASDLREVDIPDSETGRSQAFVVW